MAAETVAFRYMTRFACLGAACEDDCCSGWQVTVDEEHATLLRERMASPEEAAELSAKLKPVDKPSKHRHAIMLLDEHKHCTMLGADKLCTIQGRYGEPFIPNTCAIYPRWVGWVGTRLELSGKLSCPEIARQALFARDAMIVDRVPDSLVTRDLVLQDAGPEIGIFEPVRATLMGLLSAQRWPTGSRVLFCAFFAERLRGWLTLDASCDTARLSQEIRLLRLEKALVQLHDQLVAQVGDPVFALQAVTDSLSHMMATASPRFRELVKIMWASYEPQAGDGAAIWFEHQRRDSALSKEAAALLDQALGRVLINHVYQNWFTQSPSLFDYVAALALRYAVLRFLLVSLLPRLGAQADLERTLVSAIYSFTRTCGHDEAGAEWQSLDARAVTTLDQVAALAKV